MTATVYMGLVHRSQVTMELACIMTPRTFFRAQEASLEVLRAEIIDNKKWREECCTDVKFAFSLPPMTR